MLRLFGLFVRVLLVMGAIALSSSCDFNGYGRRHFAIGGLRRGVRARVEYFSPITGRRLVTTDLPGKAEFLLGAGNGSRIFAGMQSNSDKYQKFAVFNPGLQDLQQFSIVSNTTAFAVSRDGNRIAYTYESGRLGVDEENRRTQVYVAELSGRTHTTTKVFSAPLEIRDMDWSPDGHHLVFQVRPIDSDNADKNALVLVSFPEERTKIFPLRNVRHVFGWMGASKFAVLRGERKEQVVAIDAANGKSQPLFKVGKAMWGRISPDGRDIAMTEEGRRVLDRDMLVGQDYLVVRDMESGRIKFRALAAMNHIPVWSPDSRYVATESSRGEFIIYDNTNKRRIDVGQSGLLDGPPVWAVLP